MDKLIFKFPPDTLQERNSEGFRVLSTSKTRFTRMIFDLQSCDILETTPLQSLTSITELVILSCTMSSLLRMLKETVKLRTLKIYCMENVNLSDLPEIDFELQFLEELRLENHVKLLNVFKGACPRLKVLGVNGDYDGLELFEFVSTVASTLKEINATNVNAHYWKRIAHIERLRLVRVTGLELQDSELIRFTAKQTALEEISIKYQSTEVLHDICRNLPQLKTLNVVVHGDYREYEVTFFDSIPNLKMLDLSCTSKRNSLKFENTTHQLLEHVAIGSFTQAADWFQNFPNLRTVELSKCSIESWSQLFGSLSALQNLQKLILETIDVKQSSDDWCSPLESLRFLHLGKTELSKTNFKAIITQCPDLRQIKFSSMKTLDDDDFSMVCTKVSLLRSLILDTCNNITDNAVDHIVNFCLNLEEVHVMWCRRISKGAVQRMQKARKEILVFNW